MTSSGCHFVKVLSTTVGHSIIAMKGGRVVRRCWVKFQCQGVLLIWLIAGQGPIVLAKGAGGGGGSDIFSLVYLFSFPTSRLWETARYRLKYCLKGPLNPKQPTNQHKCYGNRSVVSSYLLNNMEQLMRTANGIMEQLIRTTNGYMDH